MQHLIIKRHKSLLLIAAVIALCLLISTSIWFLLDRDRWVYIKSRYLAGEKTQELWRVNRQLEDENGRLKKRVTRLERMNQLDTQTMAQLQKELQRLQDEVYHLKSELEFYQGIMASTRKSDGLSVQGMQIEALGNTGNYRFKLILTHVTKSDKVAEGRIDIDILGQQDGVVRTLNIKDILLDNAKDLSFKFKNFKRFEGNIMLPDGFTPQRLTVRLYSKDKNVSKIERIFDWSEMIS